MPRRDFVADLAALPGAGLPSEFTEIQAGDDDGTVVFQYALPDAAEPVSISAMVPEVAEYPESHSYFVFSISDNTPTSVNKALEGQDFLGLRLKAMMQKLAGTLSKAASQSTADDLDDEPGSDDVMDTTEDEYIDSDLDDPFRIGLGPNSLAMSTNGQTVSNTRRLAAEQIRRVKADLRKAKIAGFRVSAVGNIFCRDVSYVTIGIRVAKLGIQEDTLKAWHLDPKLYFLLIIQYSLGYRNLSELLDEPSSTHFRARLSSEYRVSLQEAISLFSQTVQASTTTQDLFISKPLNDLLNDRLFELVRYRVRFNFPWQGAEDYYNDNQGRHQLVTGNLQPDARYYALESKTLPHLSSLVTVDHMADHTIDRSFPLVAMQFALRHLVHCTEFCLVCHARVEKTFEALQPYVCSRELCLFQYLELGFGASLEHEIKSQPDVVDLLVSFCYAAAKNNAIRQMPTGLHLTVPQQFTYSARAPQSSIRLPPSNIKSLGPPSELPRSAPEYSYLLDEELSELRFRGTPPQRLNLSKGKWVHISGAKVFSQHRYIKEGWGDLFSLGAPLYETPRATSKPPPINYSAIPPVDSRTEISDVDCTPPRKTQIEVDVCLWDVSFDSLEKQQQSTAIVNLLRLLPTVLEMKQFLELGNMLNQELKAWNERLNPASLQILRWIVASNRSCIVQVDSLDADVEPSEPRVAGMSDQYIQFRFAQGAPDKEQRFIDALSSKNLGRYPTIFAWHGSPLQNWHSIVREGLDFKSVANGRAYGNGVYHSLEARTSVGYGLYYRNGGDESWPQSRLKVGAALCLSEILNSPNEFVSKTPHLVIGQIDWIQTRYLFVRCSIDANQEVRTKAPIEVLDLDPKHRLIGDSSTTMSEVRIPVTAVPHSRRMGMKAHNVNSNKKIKITEPSKIISGREDLWASDASYEEDLAVLHSDSEKADPHKTVVGRFSKSSKKTDFVSGQLDIASLPLLAPPSYATSRASLALQHELRNVLAVQEKEPLHELGWSLDPNLLGDNIYQWIFELHSFEPSLPLAKDMKARNVQSIVLEVRFGSEYPYSPPFVRVVRPRFLAFGIGGGGHVTAGGAMCMELLTNSGWNSTATMERVIFQVRMAMTSTDPNPARLERGPVRDYGMGEAVDAFIRACHTHNWKVPSDFQKFR